MAAKLLSVDQNRTQEKDLLLSSERISVIL